MLKALNKFAYMIRLGSKYIKIYKKTYFHPFISYKAAYEQLSRDRQAYSNKVLQYLNIEIKIIGQLPEEDKILYAINHRSLLDIIVMEHVFSTKSKNGVWIAKQELFDAFYGDFFKYSGCISVDIESGRGLLKFFKQIKHTLARVSNLNIYIFPEGERNKDDGIKKFQTGAQKIAKANKLDVIPVFINDKLENVFKDAPYKQTKTVEVYIGSKIDTDDLEAQYREFIHKIKG